jgi:hypothetical protein
MSNYKNTVTNHINAIVADNLPKGLFTFLFRKTFHAGPHAGTKSCWYYGGFDSDFQTIAQVCANEENEADQSDYFTTEYMIVLAFTSMEIGEAIGAEIPA